MGITSETKISEDDIKRMVKEGEENQQKDQLLKDKIEAKNGLDSMVYQAEKNIKEQGEKLPADLKAEVEDALKEAKSKLNSDDVEVLKKAKTDFEAKLHKLSEHIYKAAQTNPGAAANGG